MKRTIVSGIDIGTNTVKVVVSELTPEGALEVLGVGSSPSEGVRHGYIVDTKAAQSSIQRALDNVVRSAKLRPQQAYLSIGGVSLGTVTTDGIAYISGPDARIAEHDVEKVIRDAENKSEDVLINKKALHEIPLTYNVDGEIALTEPVGLRASKLESPVLFIHALERHIDDFISTVEDAGLEVLDVTAAPLAASFATLSTPQKMQGCILVDIGAESTDITLFENNRPLTIAVLPLGSNDLTNKLAVELQLPLTEAEKVKRNPDHADDPKKVRKILERALTDLFSEVKKAVAEVRKEVMLPAGVLITGGGSHTDGITEVAKRVLSLPTRTVRASARGVDHAPELTVAYGLCVWGASNEESASWGGITAPIKKGWVWFKQFLP